MLTKSIPLRGGRRKQILNHISEITQPLQRRDISRNLGYLFGKAHLLSKDVYNLLAECNPNHLGTSTKKGRELWATLRIEEVVIRRLCRLYGSDTDSYGGYTTGGGTESNLYLTWLAKEYFKQKHTLRDVVMLLSNFSHYSLTKAARLCEIETKTVPLSTMGYGIDAMGVEQVIKNNRSKTCFILPLTLGYPQTGTQDYYLDIIQNTKRIEKQYGVKLFIWLDASFDGLVMPFLTSFKPLKHNSVQGIAVDYHKFGQTLYPSGVVLAKQSHISLINKSVKYVNANDDTIASSRSGIPPVAIYAMMQLRGMNGYKEIVTNCYKRKIGFINELKNIDTSLTINCPTDNLSFFIKTPKHKLQQYAQCFADYNVFPHTISYSTTNKKHRSETIFKFHIFPHNTIKVLDELLLKLKQRFYEKTYKTLT